MLKPFLLALFVAAATTPAVAQTTPNAGSQSVRYQYCNLLSWNSNGRDCSLDYGQQAKPIATVDSELEALNQIVKKIDSGVAALTYLCSHGWEYVAVSTPSPGVTFYTQYLIRRPLP